jgi:SAM-dependent methyltransferase
VSYKIYLFDALDAVGWSQAAWRIGGRKVIVEDCKEEFCHDVILGNLPDGGLVVDAGCGVARWPIYLRQQGRRVFGLEYSHDACVIARENDPGLEVIESDVRMTPLANDSVDAVLSLGVVEHDEEGPMAALREAHRILKPGGVLLLAVPFNNLLRRVLVNRLLSLVTWKRRRANWSLGFAEYRFSCREVRTFLADCGFEVVSAHPNDLRPPRNMGLWVDYNNLVLDPFRTTPPDQLFRTFGFPVRLANALTRWVPWMVAGEVMFVARKG